MKRSLLLACVLGLFAVQTAYAERYAVVIGNNRGDDNETPLRWAEQDARRTQALLVELGGVAPAHTQLVLNGDAGRVQRAVNALKQQIDQRGHRPDDVLLAYYSGHGDANDLHLGGSRLAWSELERALRSTGVATLISIVDACRDEAVRGVRAKGAHHAHPFDIDLAREGGPTGRVMITAAGYDEVAQESDDLQSSFFTHHLLSGMRGAADRNRDGNVSLDELYGYAYSRTLVSSHAQLAAVQHPQLSVDLRGEGALVITRIRRGQALLSLDPSTGGDFMIVDDDSGEVVGQLWKPLGETARVALGAGRYRIQVRSGRDAYTQEVGLEWGGQASVSAQTLRQQDLLTLATKGPRLDPQRWLLGLAGRVGFVTVPGSSPLWAAGARLAWNAPGLRLFADVSLGGDRTQLTASARRYLDTRASVGVAARLRLTPFQGLIGCAAGASFTTEYARGRAGGPERQSGSALGAYAAPLLGLELPLGAAFVLGFQIDLQLSVLRMDMRLGVYAAPGFMLSIATRL